jgi:hypothetical protein
VPALKVWQLGALAHWVAAANGTRPAPHGDTHTTTAAAVTRARLASPSLAGAPSTASMGLTAAAAPQG